MATMRLTKSQWKLMSILDVENFDGWMETYLAWGDYDGMSDSASFATTKLVVHSIFRSLERKGLVRENNYGAPVLTDVGVDLKTLDRWRVVGTRDGGCRAGRTDGPCGSRR